MTPTAEHGQGGAVAHRSILGVPTRELAMNFLIYLLGVNAFLLGLLQPWDVPMRAMSLAAGVALIGLGIYVGHLRGERRAR